MKWNTYFVSMLTMVVLASLAICTMGRMKRQFSRGILRGQTLITFPRKSISACEEECSQRQKCTHASYKRRTSDCKLLSSTSHHNDQPTITRRGLVLLTKYNADEKRTLNCGNTNCTENETCSGQSRCDVNECGPPSYSSVKGNMYSINNSVQVNIGTRSAKITCTEDGTWAIEHTYPCRFGWTLIYRSCYRITEDRVRWEGAQKVCQNLYSTSHLAVIETQEEQGSISNAFNVLVKEKHFYQVWLGARQTEQNVWMWTDGSLVEDWITPSRFPRKGINCMYAFVNILYQSFVAKYATCAPDIFYTFKGLCEIDIGNETNHQI